MIDQDPTEPARDADELPADEARVRRERFERHLEEAAKIVATWPEWKRNILGRPRGE